MFRQKDYNNGDVYTFGQHGNQLTHQVMAGYGNPFPGTETTTYYDASQYFAKASETDMNGHTTSYGVGTDTAGNAGDPDPNPGDRGQVLWVRDPGYNDSSSPSYQKQYAYTYNQYGQKTSETNLSGVVTNYYYGGDGSAYAQADTDLYDTGDLIAVVQDPGAGHLNRTTTMSYDAAGRVLSSTDPLGQTSTFTYNTLGQPVSVATPARGPAPAETINYTYEANGRTQSVTDNRHTTSMAYEAGSDRVASVTDPVTGTTAYTYRLSGERATLTLPGGGTWHYGYCDAAAGWYNIPFQFRYNASAAGDMAHSNQYPNLVSGLWYLPGGDPDKLTLMPNAVTDDQNRTVSYLLNLTGTLIQVQSDQVYDSGGNRVSYLQTDLSYDDPSGNGDGTHGWLTRTQTAWYGPGAPSGGQPVSQNAYQYDNGGQRLTNDVTVGTGSPRRETYGYDDLSRLKSVDYGDNTSQSYQFDAMGNRLQRQDSAAGTTNYGYNNANMLTGSTGTNGSSYTNDLDGDTLSGGGRAEAWDSQNRMTACTVSGQTSTFSYGADGLRRSMTAGGQTTNYAYDGQTMTREFNGAMVKTATYLTGPRGPEYRRNDAAGTAPSWYVYDGLGSVVGEVDPLGNVTASDKYDVYGAVRGRSGTASTAHGFVGSLGHLSDAATGLVYMRARYYDPATGRFSSEDPAGSGANWFVYASDSPAKASDFSGKDDFDIGQQWDLLQKMINTSPSWGMNAIANRLEELADKYSQEAISEAKGGEIAESIAARYQGIALGLDDGPAKEFNEGEAARWNLRSQMHMEDSFELSYTSILFREVAELIRTDS